MKLRIEKIKSVIFVWRCSFVLLFIVFMRSAWHVKREGQRHNYICSVNDSPSALAHPFRYFFFILWNFNRLVGAKHNFNRLSSLVLECVKSENRREKKMSNRNVNVYDYSWDKCIDLRFRIMLLIFKSRSCWCAVIEICSLVEYYCMKLRSSVFPSVRRKCVAHENESMKSTIVSADRLHAMSIQLFIALGIKDFELS